MEQATQGLQDYSDQEKGAYLAAIASLATADRQASPEEMEFLQELAQSVELSPRGEQVVMEAANDASNAQLEQHLDMLKNSDLRFSLMTDVIAFAKSDGQYTSDEEAKIQKMASYLGINAEQYAALNQFVDTAETSGQSPQALAEPGFLNSSGLGNMFSKAGISSGTLMKMAAIVGPMLLGRAMSRRQGRNPNAGGLGGGLLGGLLGGALGGGGGMFGGRSSGGLGSLFSALSGGRGYGGGLGSVLGGLFKR